MRYYILALFVIACDQLTKWMIVQKMQYGESIEVIKNLLYITSHRNRGAAWGILQGKCGFSTLYDCSCYWTCLLYSKNGKTKCVTRCCVSS